MERECWIAWERGEHMATLCLLPGVRLIGWDGDRVRVRVQAGRA